MKQERLRLWGPSLKQVVGPILLGVFIVVMPFLNFVVPVLVVLAPFLLWVEVRRTRHRGLPGTLVRLGVVVGVVAAGMFVPSEPWLMNRVVGPFPQDATLHDIRVEFGRAHVRYWYPADMDTTRVDLPDGPVSIRTVLTRVEEQTRLHHRSGVFCGTYASLLMRGGPPDMIVALQSMRGEGP